MKSGSLYFWKSRTIANSISFREGFGIAHTFSSLQFHIFIYTWIIRYEVKIVQNIILLEGTLVYYSYSQQPNMFCLDIGFTPSRSMILIHSDVNASLVLWLDEISANQTEAWVSGKQAMKTQYQIMLSFFSTNTWLFCYEFWSRVVGRMGWVYEGSLCLGLGHVT